MGPRAGRPGPPRSSHGRRHTGERLDLIAAAPGAETHVSRYVCTGGAVELWAMLNVEHVFEPRHPAWGDAVLDWLEAHRRP